VSAFYDRQGRPIELMEWARLRENPLNVVVARSAFGEDEDNPDVLVSTVWLGVDHSWTGEGPPIIFETMIFGGALDGEQRRYATEAQAHEGHGYVVGLVRLELAEG
jgi:hypothetical protein